MTDKSNVVFILKKKKVKNGTETENKAVEKKIYFQYICGKLVKNANYKKIIFSRINVGIVTEKEKH